MNLFLTTSGGGNMTAAILTLESLPLSLVPPLLLLKRRNSSSAYQKWVFVTFLG
jgi:hypothetical protein